MNDDLALAQLLSTRLCHDLAGPVGAVSAGVELIGDDPDVVDEETLGLLANSAGAASRKLKFLRIAFGWAGSGSPSLTELCNLAIDYLVATAGSAGPPTLEWPSEDQLSALQDALGDDAAPLLANVVLLAFESQPACRRLRLTISSDARIGIHAVNERGDGRTTALKDDLAAAAQGDTTGLTPKTVQAALLARLSARAGLKVAITAHDENMTVSVSPG